MIRKCVNCVKCTLLSFQKSLYTLGFSATATCPSDLTATPRGRPYNSVTQLREIPACKSSFFEVHLARGVITWVPTHAPELLVTRPGSVFAFLLYHAHGSPLGVALSWIVSVPRDSPEVAWVLHESGYPLLVLGLRP